MSQRLRTACSASHAWVLSVNVPPDCTRRRADRSYFSRWRDSIRASRTGPAARGSVLRAHAGRTGRRMVWCAPEYLGDPDLRRFLLIIRACDECVVHVAVQQGRPSRRSHAENAWNKLARSKINLSCSCDRTPSQTRLDHPTAK